MRGGKQEDGGGSSWDAAVGQSYSSTSADEPSRAGERNMFVNSPSIRAKDKVAVKSIQEIQMNSQEQQGRGWKQISLWQSSGKVWVPMSELKLGS